MTNDYWTFSTPLASNTLARSETVNALFEGVETGFERLPDAEDLRTGKATFGTDTGTANAYLVALPTAPAAYVIGMMVRFAPLNTNTGSSTINVNSLGAANIRDYNGAALASGVLQAGVPAEIVYDGTQFRHQHVTTSVVPNNNTVSNAMLVDMASNTIKGRSSGSAGNPQDLSPTQVASVLSSAMPTLGAMNVFTNTNRLAMSIPLVEFSATSAPTDMKNTSLIGSNASGIFRIRFEDDNWATIASAYVIERDAAGATRHEWRIANTVAAEITATDTTASSDKTVITRQIGDARYSQIASTERFKDDVFEARPIDLREIMVREFTWGGDLSEDDPRRGLCGLGFIAEDVVEAVPEAAIHDHDGNIAGIDPLTMIAAVYWDLANRLDAIENKLEIR
ncbi:MAG: hypothetical protein AAGC92_14235 [Pseudomonadota bacterium]